MIGTLTSAPAKSDPVQAGGKAAAPAASGGLDFSALLGAVGDGEVVATGDASATPTVGDPTAAVAVAAAQVTPTLDPMVALPVAPVTDVELPGAVVPPVAAVLPAPDLPPAAAQPAVPQPVIAAPAVVAPVVTVPVTAAAPTDVVDSDEACAPQLPIKIVKLAQAPAQAEEGDVKLPTLPVDFVAQKAPKPQVATANDDTEEDTASDDAGDGRQAETAAPPQLRPEALAVPAQAAAAAVTVAVTVNATSPEPQQTARKVTSKIAAPAGKVDVAAKTDLAMTAPAVEAPTETTDRGSVGSFANLIPAHTDAHHEAAAQPILMPVQAAAPQPAQPAQAPMPTIAQQHSVALDDLMVGGAGDSAWLDRVATDISTLAKGEARQAHMKLVPASLGEVSIRLDMDGTRTRVHFTVDTPQVQAMIADNTPRLTSLVQANGLKLDGTTVDLNQQRSGGQSDRAPQQQQPETATPFNRATRETARMIERTRIAVRTERFA